MTQLRPLSPDQPKLCSCSFPAFARCFLPAFQPLPSNPTRWGSKAGDPRTGSGSPGFPSHPGVEGSVGGRIRTFFNPNNKSSKALRSMCACVIGGGCIGFRGAPWRPQRPATSPRSSPLPSRSPSLSRRGLSARGRGGVPERKVRRSLGGEGRFPSPPGAGAGERGERRGRAGPGRARRDSGRAGAPCGGSGPPPSGRG